MIKVTILAFGIAREICGTRSFELELPSDCSTEALLQMLQEKHPGLAQLAACSLAVNAVYVQEPQPLSDGDEVAIIPPVSGG